MSDDWSLSMMLAVKSRLDEEHYKRVADEVRDRMVKSEDRCVTIIGTSEEITDV